MLTQGREPENDQEVVTSIDLKNVDNPDFQINNTIKIGIKNYKIVGRGYNFMSYIDYYYQDNIIWLNNSATNDFWLNGSLDDNRDCDYYLNLDYNQMWKFNYNYSTKFFYSSYLYPNFNETKKILQENIKLTLIKVEILIFNIFGFLVLIASLFIILLFLKKEINQQRVSLGILMNLGTSRKTLSFLIAFAYVTLLVLSVTIGYASAFGLQYYLTKTISKVIFFPFPLLTFNITSTLISLLVFPAIFIICLTLIIYFFT
ncbi:FtsX-like permease family protein [Spiroplasma sp. AdecLV25b]|uniref:FtsX-like permease family protein n=1 Tax=Spiroplasma sp. AdecLV25b TaxID=3027162 RepID=UPI0027E032FF|nr:FtsX-like permease family protein [Spiroplasma sp. AdecLV25b]